MKTLTAKLLSFIFIVNVLFTGMGTQAVFAASSFNFQWNKENTLDDKLNIVSKGTNADNVFLWWDFGYRNGSSFDKGTYSLSYNIQDGRRIDLVVEKNGSTANVKYKVWDYNVGAYINISDTLYEVYKDNVGAYIEPTATNYPVVSEDYGIVYGTDGNPKEASFNIIPNTGFAFKFDNKTVKFQWVGGNTNDVFYYVTDGVSQGSIFDFDLNLSVSGEPLVEQSLQIFTGINAATFTSTPYANNRKIEIDHTTRPYVDDDPGTDPEILIEFDMPKVWDEATSKYVYLNPNNVGADDVTSVILDLGNRQDTNKIQITIKDIYASDVGSVTTFATASGAQVTASRNSTNTRISVDITKLEPGLIFNPCQVSLYKPNVSAFLADDTSIAHGVIYTYPVFTVEALAADEFYLKIQPYEGYKGYYTVKSGSTAATLSRWAQVEDSKGGTEPIYVPININAINKQTLFFQVDFVFTPPDATPGSAQVTLTSQILKFTPSDNDIVIGTPNNFEVVSAEIVPSTSSTATSVNELILKVTWNMAYAEVLKAIVQKNGGSVDVYYNLNKGDVPYDENEEVFETIKLHLSLSGGELQIEASDEDGKIKEFEWQTSEIMVGTTKYNVVRPILTLRLPTAPIEQASEQFLYPNVYFLNIKGNYVDGGTNISIPASLPDDVTLDDVVDVDVPQPQNVKVITAGENAITQKTFVVEWANLDHNADGTIMNQYYEKMVANRDLTFSDESIKYNAYITSDKSLLDKLISFDSDRENISEEVKNAIKVHNFENKKPSEGLDTSAALTADGTSVLEELRKGNIVEIENILQDMTQTSQMIQFSNLDKNQTYYVVLETVVIPFDDAKGTYVENSLDTSKLSTVVTATTLVDEEEPGPEENFPAAPDNFDKDNITLSSVMLFWDRVKETQTEGTEGSVLEYQFIRLNGGQMSDADLVSRKTFEETWEKVKADSQIAGWRTNVSDVYLFNGTDFSETPAEQNEFEYDITDSVINKLYDKTLKSNQIYYYYIRTVRMVEGKPVSYSVWRPLSVTTTPVQGPYNLKIERKISHDKETEIVVSFDTPFFDINLLGGQYELQYAIKEDNNAWQNPVAMSSSYLSSHYTQNSDGSLHFTYKISGLTNGRLYSIHTRMVDITLNEASAYSNIVQMRTEVNPDDQEEDQKKDGWIDRYKELLEELLDDPYWIIDDNTAVTSVYYRPNQFTSVLATPNPVIDLEPGEFGAKKVYYLPASAIKQAYDANKGFKISWKNSDVIIGAKAIDPELDSAIRNIIDRIDNNNVEDYFVRITAYFNEVSYTIDGSNALSPVIDVEVEAVGSEENIQQWDNDMIKYLLEEIEDASGYDADEIIDAIEDKYTNEEMVELLKELVEDFKEDFQEELDEELEDILDRNYSSAELQNNIIIAHTIASGTTAMAYRQISGIWTGITAMEYMGKKAIYTKYTGIYVFAGRTLTIPNIETIPGGQTVLNIVSKYGLDDYLGKGNTININGVLTKQMVVGCAARLSGAQTGADPYAFFVSKGINLSGRDAQSPISSQEAVYLTMMIYQTRANTDLNNIAIRNYTLTSNINGIQSNYKKSIQAAFELGIYTNQGMIPSGTMTVKEFLQMLAVLAGKVNL